MAASPSTMTDNGQLTAGAERRGIGANQYNPWRVAHRTRKFLEVSGGSHRLCKMAACFQALQSPLGAPRISAQEDLLISLDVRHDFLLVIAYTRHSPSFSSVEFAI